MQAPGDNQLQNTKTATFAAGCFWGVEAVFAETLGVIETKVGYTGGKTKNPTYEQVCSNTTNHAEAIQIQFNPKKITYKKLLDIFWKLHDPTQLNQQGVNIGTQYRSAIFYHNEKQKQEAENSKQEQQKKLNKKIVTEITKITEFYLAEDYHQKYYKKHEGLACHV